MEKERGRAVCIVSTIFVCVGGGWKYVYVYICTDCLGKHIQEIGMVAFRRGN